jgi:hypothetical protein
MSMSSNPENFEQLRRLMALKRHEQPPPGYFHHFSREVIVRIKAGETGDQFNASWWSWDGSWLQRIWAAVETRPAMAGAFGVAVCGFFAAGALMSDKAETAIVGGASAVPFASAPVPIQPQPLEPTLPVSNPAEPLQVSHQSLFQQIQHLQRPQAFNVNYVPGN